MAYAWTEIRGAKKPIKAGDQVTKADFTDGDDYDYLKESGAIRDSKFPDDVPAGTSPKAHLVSQALDLVREAETGNATELTREDIKGEAVNQ